MRSAGLISIFYLFNCRVSVLWNTNESEWGVLTPSRFLGSSLRANESRETRLESLVRMHVGAPPFFFSVSERRSEVLARSRSRVVIWLSYCLNFFFCAWSVRSVSCCCWRVAALGYPRGRIPAGHHFKCMQLKSDSFFFFLSPVSVLNHPSSLFYISKKKEKTKYINITCKCCKFCSPAREKAVNCSSRHSPKLIKITI